MLKGIPKKAVQSLVESKDFERLIVIIIALNAITLGLETIAGLSEETQVWLYRVDVICLALFTSELVLKFTAYRNRFFHDPWRVFDFLVIVIALLPAAGAFSIIRTLRVLRTLRMISVIPSLKRVVNGLLSAVPGLSSVTAIMTLIFYVGAIMSTKLFGQQFPDWFGDLGLSAYTLFQVMTLESWSMGIVRPVMEVYPWAWLFFIPFILIATFTMLNLFIAVIVNAMQVETEQRANDRAEQGHDERIRMQEELVALNRSVALLSEKIDRLNNKD